MLRRRKRKCVGDWEQLENYTTIMEFSEWSRSCILFVPDCVEDDSQRLLNEAHRWWGLFFGYWLLETDIQSSHLAAALSIVNQRVQTDNWWCCCRHWLWKHDQGYRERALIKLSHHPDYRCFFSCCIIIVFMPPSTENRLGSRRMWKKPWSNAEVSAVMHLFKHHITKGKLATENDCSHCKLVDDPVLAQWTVQNIRLCEKSRSNW